MNMEWTWPNFVLFVIATAVVVALLELAFRRAGRIIETAAEAKRAGKDVGVRVRAGAALVLIVLLVVMPVLLLGRAWGMWSGNRWGIVPLPSALGFLVGIPIALGLHLWVLKRPTRHEMNSASPVFPILSAVVFVTVSSLQHQPAWVMVGLMSALLPTNVYIAWLAVRSWWRSDGGIAVDHKA